MTKLRLKDKRIDLILDLHEAEKAKSLQAGFRQLIDEGARILPRLLVEEKNKADLSIIKDLLNSLSIDEADLIREILVEGCLCSLYKNKTDILFLLTGSEHFLLKLERHLQKKCSCNKESCLTGNLPVIIALIPGYNSLRLPGAVSSLMNNHRVFWVPFGWSFTSRLNLKVFTRTDLWDETCILALEGKQIEPFFIETPGSGII